LGTKSNILYIESTGRIQFLMEMKYFQLLIRSEKNWFWIWLLFKPVSKILITVQTCFKVFHLK
jgi:hypothetical protein